MKRLLVLSAAAGFVFSSAGKAEIIHGVTIFGDLIRFDSGNPGAIESSVPITGLIDQDTLESVVAIDFRPFDQQLYGLGSAPGNLHRLYTINPSTGLATQVGTGTLAGGPAGTSFGFDFNPFVDRLRIVNDADQNFRYVPGDATLAATDSLLAFAAGDPNAGQNPSIGGAAYTNSFVGAPSTTLFDIDFELDVLVTQDPANAGTLNTVGPLGVDFSTTVGFDISGATGAAYAASQSSGLFTIDLSTGAATLVGAIGSGLVIRDIAVVIPEPSSPLLAALGVMAGFFRRRRKA